MKKLLLAFLLFSAVPWVHMDIARIDQLRQFKATYQVIAALIAMWAVSWLAVVALAAPMIALVYTAHKFAAAPPGDE